MRIVDRLVAMQATEPLQCIDCGQPLTRKSGPGRSPNAAQSTAAKLHANVTSNGAPGRAARSPPRHVDRSRDLRMRLRQVHASGAGHRPT
jgi:hypothetical protein